MKESVTSIGDVFPPDAVIGDIHIQGVFAYVRNKTGWTLLEHASGIPVHAFERLVPIFKEGQTNQKPKPAPFFAQKPDGPGWSTVWIISAAFAIILITSITLSFALGARWGVEEGISECMSGNALLVPSLAAQGTWL